MKFKRLIALLLTAVAVSGGVAAFAGCKTKNNPDGDSGSTGNVTDGDNGENGSTEYSPILQTVLTSDYYNGLIDYVRDNNISISFNRPEFKALPYSLLEERGHDVNSIKNNKLECQSVLYYIGNDKNTLYMSLKVDNSGSYLTNYLLSYKLSEKESNDLIMLANGNYAQYPLFVQELTKQKSANINSCVNLTNGAYEVLKKRFNGPLYAEELNLTKNNLEFDVTSIDSETRILNANLRVPLNTSNKTSSMYSFNAKLKLSSGISCSNNIYDLALYTDSSSNFYELKNTKQTISYISTSVDYTYNILNIEQ